MRWTWILGLSVFGLAMGVASLYGHTRGLEAWLWFAIWALCAVLLAWRVGEKPFFYGAVTGALMALLHSFVQILFFDLYWANNPSPEPLPEGFDARSFQVMLMPLIALFSALFLGLMTLAAAKIKQAINMKGNTRS